ncbi:MAG TPA: serine hydrolase [Tepidisphaeraceae bacterium]|jgi:CubicO group peptidase (beta-lactamase class C family)
MNVANALRSFLARRCITIPQWSVRRAIVAAIVLVLVMGSLLCAQGTALPRSTPEAEGISSKAILDFVQTAEREVDALHSFLLVRHGRVVAAGWWGPYDAQTPHVLYSLSKSFTSTAVGLAIVEGKLSLDDPVLKFFPDDAPANPSANLKSMRVRDLLRMQAGQQTEAPLFNFATGAPALDEPWTKIFLAHPVPFKPGTHFLYNTAGTYMLSAIVQQVTGQTVRDYLRPWLFEPLGFEDAPTWVASPQGISAGGYGLLARTEDLANFGQLYLQKGQWNGKQLIPATWVEQATTLQTSNGSNPKSDWDQGYGFQFWRCRHGAYRGDGAFGQYCLVMPEQDAVLAMTGGLGDMQYPLDLVWDKLLPAMKSDPLSDDPAAQAALASKLAGLTMRLPEGKDLSPIAAKVTGRRYEFPDNPRGIQTVWFDFEAGPPVLTIRGSGGESHTPIGLGRWVKARDGFTNGIDHFLGMPPGPLPTAAAGAWTADDTFVAKIAAYQTPFNTTMTFHFDGDRLLIDSSYNVAFGPRSVPRLVGKAKP